MITGFEEFTHDLTEYEKNVLLPLLISGTKNHQGKQDPIINKDAVIALKSKGYKITEARFRKLMHVIRVSGMVKGVIATSKGYYVATCRDDYMNYIQSLTERIRHISNLRNAITDQFNEKYNLTPAQQDK